ncbi:hypothetical protein GE191_13105 [Serratia fonticola]|uniref:hypothetical protein n=1 Tax=Serratia fonticola TaxID=47917 RepID=UPI001377F6D7|nr:hypothetical protein [Serratia fonticola]NBJ34620.1 hypothetical protein [Serratia fonticola]
MDKQTESRKQFEKLCNEFWNWQEHDEITQGEEEPCLRWDGENYTHRVTAALWRMFNASRDSLVVELPHEVTHVTNKYYEEGRDDVISAIEAIGIRIKGEGDKP